MPSKIEKTTQRKVVGKKTAKVASLMVFGRLISLFISGIAFIIIARILGPNTYGIYILAAAYAGLAVSISTGDLGISTAFNKFIGQYSGGSTNEVNHILSNGYVVVGVFGLIITFSAFLLSGVLAKSVLGSSELSYILEIASFTIILSSLYGISYNALIGFGKGSYIALIIIVQSVVQSVFSILLAIVGYGAVAPIIGMLIAYACSTVLSLLIMYGKLGVKFVQPSIKYVKKLIYFSFPLAAYNAIRGFNLGIGPIILGIFTTAAVVGNFGVAVKTGTMITNVTDALGAAVLPMFAYAVYNKSLMKNIGKFYNYASYFTYLLITPVLLYVAFLSKQFSYTIFSSKYALAPIYISIISLGIFVWIIATYTTMLLIGANKVKEIFKYGAIIAAIELLLILTTVPHFGGIALTIILYLITPTLICVLLGRSIQKLLGVNLEVNKLVLVFVSGLISAAFLVPLIIFVHNYIVILVAGMAIQIILYPVVMAIIGAAKKKELNLLKETTSSIPILGIIVKVLVRYSMLFTRS